MGERILVTPRSLTERPHPAVEALRATGAEIVYSTPGKLPDEAELMRLVPDVTGWLAGVEPVSPAVVAAAKRLRVISRNGTGIDNLPLAELRARNIAVRTADGANARGVAELALAFMLGALRQLPATDQGMKRGEWPRLRGAEILGKVVGVIGCGAVGGTVARLAAALGAKILAFDPARPELGLSPGQFRWAAREEIFRLSDIITLHCPPDPGGLPVMDRTVLGTVKPGLILINTARASLVDETALIEALEARRVATYCVDVFDPEPPVHPGLHARADVIATAHIGGYTTESVDRATEAAVQNLAESLGLTICDSAK